MKNAKDNSLTEIKKHFCTNKVIQRDKQPWTLKLVVSLESLINLRCMFWMVGGSWSILRESTHTRAEHANTTQKDPSQDLDQEFSCCEAIAITITQSFQSQLGIINNSYNFYIILILYI